jgi:hypothetical protein
VVRGCLTGLITPLPARSKTLRLHVRGPALCLAGFAVCAGFQKTGGRNQGVPGLKGDGSFFHGRAHVAGGSSAGSVQAVRGECVLASLPYCLAGAGFRGVCGFVRLR